MEVESVGITGRGRGEQVTTYPNCVPVGRAGGTWGRIQDTPLDPAARERKGEGGSGGRASPAVRAQLQMELKRFSSGRGGGGLKRPAERDMRVAGGRGGKIQDNKSPPGKKTNSRPSPSSSKPSTKAITEPPTSHNKQEVERLIDMNVEEVVEEDTEEEEASVIDSHGESDVEAELTIEGAVMV